MISFFCLFIVADCFISAQAEFFADSLRSYYTVRQNQIVLLLVGGDKSTQSKDIEAASRLIDELEE